MSASSTINSQPVYRVPIAQTSNMTLATPRPSKGLQDSNELDVKATPNLMGTFSTTRSNATITTFQPASTAITIVEPAATVRPSTLQLQQLQYQQQQQQQQQRNSTRVSAEQSDNLRHLIMTSIRLAQAIERSSTSGPSSPVSSPKRSDTVGRPASPLATTSTAGADTAGAPSRPLPSIWSKIVGTAKRFSSMSRSSATTTASQAGSGSNPHSAVLNPSDNTQPADCTAPANEGGDMWNGVLSDHSPNDLAALSTDAVLELALSDGAIIHSTPRNHGLNTRLTSQHTLASVPSRLPLQPTQPSRLQQEHQQQQQQQQQHQQHPASPSTNTAVTTVSATAAGSSSRVASNSTNRTGSNTTSAGWCESVEVAAAEELFFPASSSNPASDELSATNTTEPHSILAITTNTNNSNTGTVDSSKPLPKRPSKQLLQQQRQRRSILGSELSIRAICANLSNSTPTTTASNNTQNSQQKQTSPSQQNDTIAGSNQPVVKIATSVPSFEATTSSELRQRRSTVSDSNQSRSSIVSSSSIKQSRNRRQSCPISTTASRNDQNQHGQQLLDMLPSWASMERQLQEDIASASVRASGTVDSSWGIVEAYRFMSGVLSGSGTESAVTSNKLSQTLVPGSNASSQPAEEHNSPTQRQQQQQQQQTKEVDQGELDATKDASPQPNTDSKRKTLAPPDEQRSSQQKQHPIRQPFNRPTIPPALQQQQQQQQQQLQRRVQHQRQRPPTPMRNTPNRNSTNNSSFFTNSKHGNGAFFKSVFLSPIVYIYAVFSFGALVAFATYTVLHAPRAQCPVLPINGLNIPAFQGLNSTAAKLTGVDITYPTSVIVGDERSAPLCRAAVQALCLFNKGALSTTKKDGEVQPPVATPTATAAVTPSRCFHGGVAVLSQDGRCACLCQNGYQGHACEHPSK
ncbi:hypothetical protein GQ42DRAFT_6052 [Ramicandelaber brevisporus]|nr:hypothetical protein GQ42DRAFT_6052 [Ramicandelaber brevisporus]